jgi:hypothetical protein
MLKAGALYFAIVIAFIIAVITASLIMLAAHYRNDYLKQMRFNQLLNNLNSGITYMLAQDNITINREKIDLFGNQTDSLTVERKIWGVYEVAIIQSFIAKDTLKKVFLIGTAPDSVVLYLTDEDRPLSMSGTTKLTGNAFLPKAGLKKAYAEGKPYANKELIYNGRTEFSKRTLKKLDTLMIDQLRSNLTANIDQLPLLAKDSLNASFSVPSQMFALPSIAKLQNITLKNNIILISDSVVHIAATALLDGIQIYAPVIKVESGFVGNCQLFASDSIIVSSKTVFNYPSVLGVISKKNDPGIPTIKLADEVNFNGIIFTYEEKRSPLQTIISLGKETKITGEIYSTGMIKLEKGVVINGKLSCNKFIMQTPSTLYENFLIDVTFNRKARSKYYLSSKLFERNSATNILKWLN